ncbi:MAG: hypothetical protein ACREPT_09535 [Rudaea sp.]
MSSTNLWKRLQGILPAESLRLGTIITDPASVAGTVLVQMANGGTLRARGAGTIGDTVFILGGEVRSTVSGLTTFADEDV